MQFLTDYYRNLSPMIAALTLLPVLSYCTIDLGLRRRGVKRAALTALALAWAIGVAAAVVFAAVGGPRATEVGILLFPIGVAVLLLLACAAPVYLRLASTSVTVAIGLAAMVGIAISPVCELAGLLALCARGCPHP
jgi:peptidoglycan/LPS O-acetylase OafA/YrhL